MLVTWITRILPKKYLQINIYIRFPWIPNLLHQKLHSSTCSSSVHSPEGNPAITHLAWDRSQRSLRISLETPSSKQGLFFTQLYQFLKTHITFKTGSGFKEHHNLLTDFNIWLVLHHYLWCVSRVHFLHCKPYLIILVPLTRGGLEGLAINTTTDKTFLCKFNDNQSDLTIS